MKHKVRHIHFVGIGGSGMSGIAEVLLNLGYVVSGSDLKDSAATRRLAALGAQIRDAPEVLATTGFAIELGRWLVGEAGQRTEGDHGEVDEASHRPDHHEGDDAHADGATTEGEPVVVGGAGRGAGRVDPGGLGLVDHDRPLGEQRADDGRHLGGVQVPGGDLGAAGRGGCLGTLAHRARISHTQSLMSRLSPKNSSRSASY